MAGHTVLEVMPLHVSSMGVATAKTAVREVASNVCFHGIPSGETAVLTTAHGLRVQSVNAIVVAELTLDRWGFAHDRH
jgi:hypothetical protein